MGELKWTDPAFTLRAYCGDDASEDPSPPTPLPQGERGEDSHGLSSRMSLVEFYRAFIAPVLFVELRTSPLTLREWDRSLALWAEITGDPPLDKIDDYTTSQFVAGLYVKTCRRGLASPKDGHKFSEATIHKHCRHCQSALYLAGPKCPAHRKAQGLIEDVPYIEKPELDDGRNEDSFTLAEVSAILQAAERMPRPCWPGIPPGDWWQSLAVVAWNTGERRGALLTVEQPAADADLLEFPKLTRKGRKKSHRVPINDACRAAIERIRTPRKVLFPWKGWPGSNRWFHANWRLLLEKAGLPVERRFGLHGLRRGAATAIAELSPLAAQLLCGHKDFATTERHYIHPKLLRTSLDQMPQPEQPTRRDPQRRLFE